jgi:hypothetical protein
LVKGFGLLGDTTPKTQTERRNDSNLNPSTENLAFISLSDPATQRQLSNVGEDVFLPPLMRNMRKL